MLSSKFKLSLLSAATALAVTAPFGAAQASNGQLMHCVGTYKCGMGGAGMTIASDPTAAMTNPALAQKMDNEAIISVGAFRADVEGELNGNFANSSGRQASEADLFANGSLGVNFRLDETKAINVSIYPGGGGATNWAIPRTDTAVGGGETDGTDSDITWRMINMNIGMGYQLNPVTTLGGAIVLHRSSMKTDSLDNGFGRDTALGQTKWANGISLQGGILHQVNNNLTLGGNVFLPIAHERFDGYESVFNSAISPPAMVGVGADYKFDTGTQVALDFKTVHNSSVRTISTNSAQNTGEGGFGWDDQLVVMFGVQQSLTDNFTVRAGYNYGDFPIDDDQIFANFLFPAIVQHHFTAGASLGLTEAMEVGVSGYWTPRAHRTEFGTGDAFSSGGAGTQLWHQQYGGQVSLKYKF